jgi:hypothetical protein
VSLLKQFDVVLTVGYIAIYKILTSPATEQCGNLEIYRPARVPVNGRGLFYVLSYDILREYEINSPFM